MYAYFHLKVANGIFTRSADENQKIDISGTLIMHLVKCEKVGALSVCVCVKPYMSHISFLLILCNSM